MMTPYKLTDRQKHLLRSIVPGLQDATVSPEWVISTGDDRITMIHGLDRSGKLWRDVWNGVKESDFTAFTRCGLFQAVRTDQYGRPVAFNLDVYSIIEAVNNDFEPRIDIHLEPEHQGLLCTLVEAARNVPPDKRVKFVLEATTFGSSPISHPGLPSGKTTVYVGDLETLARDGLLAETPNPGGSGRPFDVTPLGFKYYRQVKRDQGQPLQRVETAVLRYLDTDQFRKKYPTAYSKWADAVSLLTSNDVDARLSAIGHLCREAGQDFATALVERFRPPDVDPNTAHTKNRLQKVLEVRAKELGNTERAFLETLVVYWDKVNDLIQRQVHERQKEGQPIVWEDARRLVFQTAIVMYEIENSLSRAY